MKSFMMESNHNNYTNRLLKDNKEFRIDIPTIKSHTINSNNNNEIIDNSYIFSLTQQKKGSTSPIIKKKIKNGILREDWLNSGISRGWGTTSLKDSMNLSLLNNNILIENKVKNNKEDNNHSFIPILSPRDPARIIFSSATWTQYTEKQYLNKCIKSIEKRNDRPTFDANSCLQRKKEYSKRYQANRLLKNKHKQDIESKSDTISTYTSSYFSNSSMESSESIATSERKI